jgi:hypothetical protein
LINLWKDGGGPSVVDMAMKETYSQAARVEGILRTLGARHGITVGAHAYDNRKR